MARAKKPDDDRPLPKLITISEAAEALGLHEKTVRRLVGLGHLTAYRLPGSHPGARPRAMRVDKADVLALLDSSRTDRWR